MARYSYICMRCVMESAGSEARQRKQSSGLGVRIDKGGSL